MTKNCHSCKHSARKQSGHFRCEHPHTMEKRPLMETTSAHKSAYYLVDPIIQGPHRWPWDVEARNVMGCRGWKEAQ